MIREDQIEKYCNLQSWLIQAETVVTPLLAELTKQREWRELLKRHRDLIDYTGDLVSLLCPLIKQPPKHRTVTNETRPVSVHQPLSEYFFQRIAKRKAMIEAGGTCPVLDKFQFIALSDLYFEPVRFSIGFRDQFKKENSIVQIIGSIEAVWYELNEILADATGTSPLFDESRYIGIPEEVEI